jgi:hypothetical protein
MKDKTKILAKTSKFLQKKGSFAYRICKLLNDGEFSAPLSSNDLIHLLNEGVGKKIKAADLTASMRPLQQEDIIKVKIINTGRSKQKFWFPGWLDKQQAEKTIGSGTTKCDVSFFTGENSWTDPNKNFPKIIEILQGDLCIVDPFYGNGTFFVLEKFGKTRKIRFLSSQLGNEEQQNPTKFDINLRRFKKEFKNIELRKFDKPYELHDRYIIAKNALVIIGHGIKDLANKESFVIFLPEKLVKNFLPQLKERFEQKWKKSGNIS